MKSIIATFVIYLSFHYLKAQAPVASYNWSYAQGPNIIQFNDESINQPSSWHWSFGDGTISTAQNPLKTFIQPGLFTVCLKATNNFGSDSTCHQIWVTTFINSVNESQATNDHYFKLVPNPGNGSVHLIIPESMVGEILVVSDISGKQIATGLLTNTNWHLSVANWSYGTYFVRVGSTVKKLLVY